MMPTVPLTEREKQRRVPRLVVTVGLVPVIPTAPTQKSEAAPAVRVTVRWVAPVGLLAVLEASGAVRLGKLIHFPAVAWAVVEAEKCRVTVPLVSAPERWQRHCSQNATWASRCQVLTPVPAVSVIE